MTYPRINSDRHAEVYPDKYVIFRSSKEDWWVMRGYRFVAARYTWQEALDALHEHAVRSS